MLKIEHLKVRGLPHLSFEVPSGECFAVLGPSGSGKTLLLRAIADLDPDDPLADGPGHVFVSGAERREMPASKWRRLVRYVPAEPAWWADTVRQHLPPDADPARLLRSLGLEPAILDRPLAVLSTGERQRLALVRALIDEPRVLLLDEPTAALDPTNTALVEELIRFQILQGRSVILVSHDPEQARRLAHSELHLGALDHFQPKEAQPDDATA